jgi:hypothetical protein
MFRRQSRDLYIPVDDIGFWQAAYRDPDDPEYPAALSPSGPGSRRASTCSTAITRAASA